MEDTESVETLIDSATTKIQQLQKAFAELESYRAVALNLKWKELEAHFHGLEKSLKRRFHELEDQEKTFETKNVEAHELLQKREATVLAMEQASLQRLQEKRDVAAGVIVKALEKHKKGMSADAVVTNVEQLGESIVKGKVPDQGVGATKINLKGSENGVAEVKLYPELDKLCENMDSEGLHKFISDNRKNIAALKEEIPHALKAASSPACLILNSLKDFYNMDLMNTDGKKDSNLLGLRRTCIMLMECLSVLLTWKDSISVADIITEEIKHRAELIAEEWKPKLDCLDIDVSNGNSLEAHAFLQLLATFGIASGFDEKYLLRLIPMVSRRHQTADLCRSLGLSDKMPGVIQILVNSGRQIDAVNLAFAFDLTDQFPPVQLLKSYLQEIKKISSPVRAGNSSPPAQVDVLDKELTALKAVIKCIEEHKLEEQYPVDPLQKKVVQLEKVKADKKRATEVSKPQSKRPRANVGGCMPRVANIVADKTFYPRYTHYAYDRPYVYSGHTDNHGASFFAAAAYGLPPPAHSNFFGNSYPYQAAYMH